jgi:hypothetical protein
MTESTDSAGEPRPGEESARVGVIASDFAEANPPSIDIPSMICPQERNFYFWAASNLAPGVGAVVEFGTWLGGSTVCLSAGLRGRPMHCYDNFRWYEDDNSKSDVKLKEGDDFYPLFSENIGRYGANVVVHRASIADFTWEGGLIELLVIDAPKLAADFARLLTVFGPSLIPGQTRIVLQDYQHFPSYQISVVMDAIRSSAILEHVVVAANNRQPNTVSFFVANPIDTALIAEAAATFTTWSSDRIHAVWSRIMAPLPDQARARMAPGLALFLYDAGHEDEALGVLAETPMDKTMLKRWKRMGELKHPMAGVRPSESYPRLYRLMEETRLDPTRAIPNAKRQEDLFLAVSLDREADPSRYLAAWKAVLAQSSPRSNAAKRAAKRIVSVADELGEPSDVVDGLIALVEITPQDRGTRERLASAAISARHAQKALDCLARHGLADLAAPGIGSLHERVCVACEGALRAGDSELALSLFHSLERVDAKHVRLESLRPSLAEQAAALGASA